jgi:hypothetical protein
LTKNKEERFSEMHPTTFDDAVGAVSDYFHAVLTATEDFDAFCAHVDVHMRRIAAAAVARCVERFDREIASSLPRSWEARGRPSKRVVTMFGAVEYVRTLYRDEYGRNRYPTDEILGIPKRSTLTSDAFLWIIRRAAVVSYRRAADDFSQMSGERVSAMCAWRCVQREGALIASDIEEAPPGTVSQTDVYAECDGIFLALQTRERRDEAVSRFLYEQSRMARSFELKCGVVYAGRRKVSGRNVRGNVALFATAGGAEALRRGMRATCLADYVEADIEALHTSSDAGTWCADMGLDGVGASHVRGIDSFHVMRYVHRAFPDGAGREYLVSLALRHRPEAFASACDRMLPKVRDPKRRERIRECRDYVSSNAELLRTGGSLGTMEATNATVWAKRMKSFGCSWSKDGAEAMALVLCRTCASRPLVAPPKDAFFSETEKARADAVIARRGAEAAAQYSSGHGWEPPHMAQTWALPREQCFRARTC